MQLCVRALTCMRVCVCVEGIPYYISFRVSVCFSSGGCLGIPVSEYLPISLPSWATPQASLLTCLCLRGSPLTPAVSLAVSASLRPCLSLPQFRANEGSFAIRATSPHIGLLCLISFSWGSNSQK